MQKVVMKKTKAPNEIPNGTLGVISPCGNFPASSFGSGGLHYVEFETGFVAYVYESEMTLLSEEDLADFEIDKAAQKLCEIRGWNCEPTRLLARYLVVHGSKTNDIKTAIASAQTLKQ